MSIELSLDDDDKNMADAERVILSVYVEQEGIIAEVEDKETQSTVYCQEILWPENYGVREDAKTVEGLQRVEKEFEAVPEHISITFDCHPDGFLIEVIGEQSVETYYRLEYEDWGFEVGEEKPMFF